MQSSVNASSTPPNLTPNHIHFVWVGGPMPVNYLLTLKKLSTVAKHSDFKLYLWVDDQKNLSKTAEKIAIAHDIHAFITPDIHVKFIHELDVAMRQDPFFAEAYRRQRFWHSVNREGVGYTNQASASDFLRIEILRQMAGTYFDTDTIFKDLEDIGLPDDFEQITLQQDDLIYGIMTNVTLRWNRVSDEITLRECPGSNDVIAVAQTYHPALTDTLLTALNNYRLADVIRHNGKSCMDEKRFPFYPKYQPRHLSTRARSTINLTGPAPLIDSVLSFWKKQPKVLKEQVMALTTVDKSVAGLEIDYASDQTWLKDQPLKSFDDQDIDNRLKSRPG